MRTTDRAARLTTLLATFSLLAVACGSVESEPQAQQSPVSEIVGEAPEISATHDLACAVAGEVVTIEFGEGSTYKTRPDATEACARLSEPRVATAGATEETSTTTNALEEPKSESVAELFDRVGTGVLRILSTSCNSQGSGTGFLISDRHIATAAHVIDDAESVELETLRGPVSAEVVGIDSARDLAVLQVPSPIEGHIFDLEVSKRPLVGADLISIGFPAVGRGEKTLARGVVSGFNDGDILPIEMVQTDTQITSGNSGGPLLSGDGSLVAIAQIWETADVGTGAGFGATIQAAEPFLSQWVNSPQAVPRASCQTSAPSVDTVQLRGLVDVRTNHPSALFIADDLSIYMEAINLGLSEVAWNKLSFDLRERIPLAKFAEETSTSFNLGVTLWTVDDLPSGHTSAVATFTSLQDEIYGPNGESCTNWTVEYTMRFNRIGGWEILAANNVGQSPQRCI